MTSLREANGPYFETECLVLGTYIDHCDINDGQSLGLLRLELKHCAPPSVLLQLQKNDT